MSAVWVQTASGRRFDLIDPTPDMVEPGDIAVALSRIPRFNGHTAFPYSVAQHCCLGADALFAEGHDRPTAAHFLLHDAHEAYVGDMPTPVRDAYAVLVGHEGAFKLAHHQLRKNIDAAIFARAGVSSAWMFEAAVRSMDLRMLRTERDALMVDTPAPWVDAVEQARPVDRLVPGF